MTRQRYVVTCAPGPDGQPIPLTVVAAVGRPVELHTEAWTATFTLPRSADADDLADAVDAAVRDLARTVH